MSSRPKDTTWSAEPHTIAKVKLIENYIQVWASILGTSRRDEILTYIDGFAGPGAYKNFEYGSPIAALNSLNKARIEAGTRWKARGIRTFFIEDKPDRCQYLRDCIRELELVRDIEVNEPLCCSFEAGVRTIETQEPYLLSSNAPLFSFVDPFGVKGIPFTLIEKLLSSSTSEMLLNFNSDGIIRNYRAHNYAIIDEVFGTNDWLSVVDPQMDNDQIFSKALCFYKQRLRAAIRDAYIFSFEMADKQSNIDYYLIFASQHIVGLKKMKEQMRKIDHTGNYQFFDAFINQHVLFRFDDYDSWLPIIVQKCQGKMMSLHEFEKFILVDTPFITFKDKILKPLEKQARIEVLADHQRPSFKYPEDLNIKIKFKQN